MRTTISYIMMKGPPLPSYELLDANAVPAYDGGSIGGSPGHGSHPLHLFGQIPSSPAEVQARNRTDRALFPSRWVISAEPTSVQILGPGLLTDLYVSIRPNGRGEFDTIQCFKCIGTGSLLLPRYFSIFGPNDSDIQPT